MDEIIELLNRFGIEDYEVEELVNICPGLEIVDVDKAKSCIIAVIKSGYPLEDISSLIYANPSFMMYEPNVLVSKLKSLGGDIERKLKDNPYII